MKGGGGGGGGGRGSDTLTIRIFNSDDEATTPSSHLEISFSRATSTQWGPVLY